MVTSILTERFDEIPAVIIKCTKTLLDDEDATDVNNIRVLYIPNYNNTTTVTLDSPPY